MNKFQVKRSFSGAVSPENDLFASSVFASLFFVSIIPHKAVLLCTHCWDALSQCSH